MSVLPATEPVPSLLVLSRAPCERCLGEAAVVVLDGYDGEQPTYRHYCLGCSEAIEIEQLGAEGPQPFRPHMRAWAMVVGGLALGVLATLAEPLQAVSDAGFGFVPRFGLAAAGLCAVLGVVIRVVPLALAGALGFIGLALFDVVFDGATPGWGWKQAVALLVAAGLFSAGILTRIRQGGWSPGSATE